MMRPVKPKALRCFARRSEKERLASPRTNASAVGSVTSSLRYRPMVETPGACGAASAALPRTGMSERASATTSRILRYPSAARSTCLKSLCDRLRRRETSSCESCSLCFKVSTTSRAPPPAPRFSLRWINWLLICSADERLSSDGSGPKALFSISCSSDAVAVLRTYLAATSSFRPHLRRSSSTSGGSSFMEPVLAVELRRFNGGPWAALPETSPKGLLLKLTFSDVPENLGRIGASQRLVFALEASTPLAATCAFEVASSRGGGPFEVATMGPSSRGGGATVPLGRWPSCGTLGGTVPLGGTGTLGGTVAAGRHLGHEAGLPPTAGAAMRRADGALYGLHRDPLSL
mmetsp:Transcript_20765/g.45685  ORF Transcript_20765/g.45685 Transcript_20765/m.45685 type:complete len:347 (+) Transcript_20765:842-1882(+)